MPQGGIEENEAPYETAIRELMEEVGTDNVKLLHQSKNWYAYDFPDDLRSIVWSGKYVGQKQMWFLFKFLGKDSEINIKTKNPEFINWKWIEFDRLPEIIVYFKKELYLNLVKEFGSIVSSI